MQGLQGLVYRLINYNTEEGTGLDIIMNFVYNLGILLLLGCLTKQIIGLSTSSSSSSSSSNPLQPQQSSSSMNTPSSSSSAKKSNPNNINTNNSKSLRIISINKNGGNVKIFDFNQNENTAVDTTEKQQSQSSQNQRRRDSIISFIFTIRNQLLSAIRTTFLPTGYPARTPPGYLKYSIWSWIQDLSTQLRSVLATQRILEGVGVGREGATALSALFNYLVRDGFGMLATLLFTYSASTKFRTDCKRWRIFADVSNDVGITLEVTATLFPNSFFLPMICLGNVFKAMCGVAAGACGGSINLHWSKGSDISDINAKFGAQHTVTAALGLIFAGIFAKYVDRVSSTNLWTLYFSLTFLHVYANVHCMRLISFDYLNTIRMNMILTTFWRHFNDKDKGSSSNTIKSPQDISKQEPLWFFLPLLQSIFAGHKHSIFSSIPIYFGEPFDEFCQYASTTKNLDQIKSEILENQNDKERSNLNTIKDGYLITSGYKSNCNPCVVVSFFANATPLQQTKAYFHANLLRQQIEEQEQLMKQVNNVTTESRLTHAESVTEKMIEVEWATFVGKCTESGWDLTRSELQTRGYEIQIE